MTLQNCLQIIEHCVAYSARNFFNRQFLAELAVRYLILEYPFSIFQEILQSHSFLMLLQFETQGCHWYAIKRIKSIFADKGNIGAKCDAPLHYPKLFKFFQ